MADTKKFARLKAVIILTQVYQKGFSRAKNIQIGFFCWTTIPKLRFLCDQFTRKLTKDLNGQCARCLSLLTEKWKFSWRSL